ncbi:MAG: agmatinase [Candidatus Aenigmatarchaeota archaeon]|nr:MAG: agmatinase [Candidatus Aenigmarchaeota archaeon]
MLYLRKTFSYEYPLEKADVVLAGIPFDSTETGKSVKYGPLFIREAIKNLPGYDPELKTNIFEKLKFCDSGDIEVVPGSWKLTKERINDTVKWIFNTNPKVLPVFLGGDHLITLGILESLKDFFKNITIIHFDAHRDLLPEYMGERFSHITWAYHTLKQGFQIFQTGCRSWYETEERVYKKYALKTAKNIKGPVYITIDMDVFDPAYAPEVGTPEPNGMKPEEFFNFIKEIPLKNIIGMDLVECASDKINTKTSLLAANIFKKVLGLWVKK